MNPELSKRLRSFAWRLGMVLLAVSLDFVAKNLTDFNLPDEMTLILGLVLGEVSKYLNKR